MNLFKIFILLALSAFSSSVCMAYSPHRKGFKPLTDQLIVRVFESLQNQYPRLELGTTGVSSFDGIREVTMYVSHCGKLDKMEARRILVYAVTLLVEAINRDEVLSPFLNPRPFSTDQVNVGLVIRHLDGRPILHPDFSAASLLRGEVFFGTVDEKGIGYKGSETEPYAETLRLVGNGVDQ